MFAWHKGTLQYITTCRVSIVPHIQTENFQITEHTSGHCVLMPREYKCTITKKGRESLPEECRHPSYKPYKKTILLQTNAKETNTRQQEPWGMNLGNYARRSIVFQRLPFAFERNYRHAPIAGPTNNQPTTKLAKNKTNVSGTGRLSVRIKGSI